MQTEVKPPKKIHHTRRSLAERWRCHPRTVARLEKDDPDFPRRIHLTERHFIYAEADVEAYEAARRREVA